MNSSVGSWTSNKPEGYMTCYIYNMLTNVKIEFKTLPEDVNESYSSDWQQTDVMGRSAPYLAYTSSSARTVDYSVTLNRDIMGDAAFRSTIDQCKKLVYPKYAHGSIVAPPYCYVRFGGMITMFAVVDSVSVNWSGPIIGDDTNVTNPNNNVFSQAEISFSFIELRCDSQGLPQGDNLGYVTGKEF